MEWQCKRSIVKSGCLLRFNSSSEMKLAAFDTFPVDEVQMLGGAPAWLHTLPHPVFNRELPS